MIANRYFVRASISADGRYAHCSYFYDQQGTQPVDGSKLRIPPDAKGCRIQEAEGSALALLGAVFKTRGHKSKMDANNFCPAQGQSGVDIPMPTDATVTKGVVLLFSTPDTVGALYASADPEVVNGSETD